MEATTLQTGLPPTNRADEQRLTGLGFRWGEKGTHTSRTIMFDDLRSVLASRRPEAPREEYLSAIHDDNCLRKRTAATRKLSSQRLSELYALDPDVPLFRVMRRLWYGDEGGRPILALLLALARDPLLRSTAAPILGLRPGEELARQQLTDALDRSVRGRVNRDTLDKIVRNAASSWTQSGHLVGRGRKVRKVATANAATAAFALLLAYLLGFRGTALFGTLWARVLDAPEGDLMRLANDARRLGLLDMSQSGGVIDIVFGRLITPDERR